MANSKVKKIVDNPDQWIITGKGDFVRIKDDLKLADKKLEIIRQKLSSSRRFKGKTSEQISKERYDKVLEEVDFDYNKLHDWIYNEKSKDKIEIIKKSELSYHDGNQIIEAITKYVEKNVREKWRIRLSRAHNGYNYEGLVNEETGQIFYYLYGPLSWLVQKQGWEIPTPEVINQKESTVPHLFFSTALMELARLTKWQKNFRGWKLFLLIRQLFNMTCGMVLARHQEGNARDELILLVMLGKLWKVMFAQITYLG